MARTQNARSAAHQRTASHSVAQSPDPQQWKHSRGWRRRTQTSSTSGCSLMRPPAPVGPVDRRRYLIGHGDASKSEPFLIPAYSCMFLHMKNCKCLNRHAVGRNNPSSKYARQFLNLSWRRGRSSSFHVYNTIRTPRESQADRYRTLA